MYGSPFHIGRARGIRIFSRNSEVVTAMAFLFSLPLSLTSRDGFSGDRIHTAAMHSMVIY